MTTSLPALERNEVFLISGGTSRGDATSVLQGEGGFLLFRQWALEPVRGEKIWRIKSEFMLGTMGRHALIALFASDPNAQIWRGEIVAEAATTFKNGQKSVWSAPHTLDVAKAWVQSRVAGLLEAGEQLSQAFVAMPGDEITYELDPSTWGSAHPSWHTWEE